MELETVQITASKVVIKMTNCKNSPLKNWNCENYTFKIKLENNREQCLKKYR